MTEAIWVALVKRN